LSALIENNSIVFSPQWIEVRYIWLRYLYFLDLVGEIYFDCTVLSTFF
jgi:hypothetical protein